MKRSILMWLFDLTNTGHEKPVEVSVDCNRTRNESVDSDGAKIKRNTFDDESNVGSRNLSFSLSLDVALTQMASRSPVDTMDRSKAVDERILHERILGSDPA